ncbi:MAG TPA: class I SAM-dependent methyltransferase [Ktedonobacterales bacterium]|nr:class I SAM-dependent methyltransferase [Ktedonobacterales bacterium]
MSFNLLDHHVYHSAPQRAVISAWTQHIPFGMLLIDLLRPRLVVELGTHMGASYCAFCQAVTELGLGTRCVAVDCWEGDPQAGKYGPEVLEDLQAHHDPRYGDFSTLMRSSFDDAVSAFADGSIDLLHIDGLHAYEAVKHDLETWLPKMSSRGVIILHDIAERQPTFGVWRLWDELKQTYPHHLEFEHGHGLGLVAVGENAPEGLQSVFDLPPDQWSALRDLMRDLGASFDEQVVRVEELHQNQAQLRNVQEVIEHERHIATQKITHLNEVIQQAHGQVAAQAITLDAQQRELAETQRRLDNALWQLDWLNRSRGVRMVKLARASRALLRQRGAGQLAKRAALWAVGKRGYYRLDSAAALPVPKQARPIMREYKQVMFLSGCPGGAMRYRCDHQAEQLNLLGCSAESEAIATVNLMELLDRFQCFVLHRVPFDSDVHAFMTEARARGKALFFETDDLVFVPGNAKHQAELERFSPRDRALYIDEMGRIRQTLHLCDAVTVSTDPLREWIEPLCSRVAVTPNVASREMVARSQMALAAHSALPGAVAGDGASGGVVIAYFSGSPSHDRDFLEAQDALLWALETYPQTRFLLVGPLKLSEQFERFGERVRHEPVRPWQALPALYADVAINLAPLERDNPFTEAKSSIKYLEAALLKVPTIASPRNDFTRVMRHGENGLLADSPDAWREALRQLIESPEERRRMGERAYEEVMAQQTTTSQAPLVYDVMRSHFRAVKPSRDQRRLRVNWVVDAPDAAAGARMETTETSGTMRLASALARQGHTVRVVIAAPAADVIPPTWQAEAAPAEIVIGYDAAPVADASVATSAATSRIVADHHESLFRFYLVTDATAGGTSEPDGALPLRRICLAPGATQSAEGMEYEAARLSQLLLEHCW